MEARKSISTSAEEREFVRNQINIFNKRYEKLFHRDMLVDGIKVGTGVGMWLTDSPFLLLCLGYLVDKASNFYIPEKYAVLRAEFEDQLERLVQMVKEYWKVGPTVTLNQSFLDLLETISPFIRRDFQDIFLPIHLRHLDAYKTFSTQYKELLLKLPFSITIPEVGQAPVIPVNIPAVENKKVEVAKVQSEEKLALSYWDKAVKMGGSWYGFIMDDKVAQKSAEVKSSHASSATVDTKVEKNDIATVIPSIKLVATATIPPLVDAALEKTKQKDPVTEAIIESGIGIIKSAANTYGFFKNMKQNFPVTVGEFRLYRYGYVPKHGQVAEKSVGDEKKETVAAPIAVAAPGK